MPVIILGTNQKRSIVTEYEQLQLSITEIAARYGCSTGTVRRVLQEAKVLPPTVKRVPKPPPINSDEANKVMGLLYRMGISYDLLESIINAPTLTANNVALFLKQSNPAQLAIVLTAAGLTETLQTIDLPTKPISKDAQQPLFPPE